MKPVLFAAVAALAVTAAYADTVKDANFAVTPGRWEWRQETHVAGIPIKETNIECLDDEKAQMTLKGLAVDLDESCTVDNVANAAGGYTFKLICNGDIPGTADAQLVHTDTTMAISAKGKAKLMGIPAGFSVKANATYLGACTPEELQRG